MSQAIVYLIRHGEKPEPEGNGLSAKGVTRADALPGVFGPQSAYNIGYIMAEHPKAGKLHASILLELLDVPILPSLPLGWVWACQNSF